MLTFTPLGNAVPSQDVSVDGWNNNRGHKRRVSVFYIPRDNKIRTVIPSRNS
jgi:hypothetical protein